MCVVLQASAGEGALLLPELTKRQRKMVYKAEKQRVKLRKRNKRKEVRLRMRVKVKRVCPYAFVMFGFVSS